MILLASLRSDEWTAWSEHVDEFIGLRNLTRTKSELLLENMLLRQQLIVLKRQAKRPTLTWRDQTLFVLVASRLRTWKQALVIVQPETVVLAEYPHPSAFRAITRKGYCF
jgi:hypothetical protein